MPAEGAGGDFEQYDGDFDDGNEADDEPVLDDDEDGEPWAVDEMSERRRAGLERSRAARAVAAARCAGERADPFAAVRVGYLAELFGSPRFTALDASSRHSVLLHALHITTRSTWSRPTAR